MQEILDSIACKGECYIVSIYSSKLDVKFCFPHELRKSLYLECHEDFIQSLLERPVVGFMLETSPLYDKKVVLGDILLSVNDVQVHTPKEANLKIRTSRRPLKLLFFAPKVKLTISEGFHMCKYNTSTAKPPKSSLKWKPKYVVIGGVIAVKPWVMYMYRNKIEYDRAVMETISGKNVSVKVKQFSLRDATLLYKDETEVISYGDSDRGTEWRYIVIIPNEKTRHKPIKIAAPNEVALRPVHEAVQRIINQDDYYDTNRHKGLFARGLNILPHGHHQNMDFHRRGSTGSTPPTHLLINAGRRNSFSFELQQQSKDPQYYDDHHYNNMHQIEISEDDYHCDNDNNNYHKEDNISNLRRSSSICQYDVTAANNGNYYHANNNIIHNPISENKNSYNLTNYPMNNKIEDNNISYSFKNAKGERIRSNTGDGRIRRNPRSTTTVASGSTKSTANNTDFTVNRNAKGTIDNANIETLMTMNINNNVLHRSIGDKNSSVGMKPKLSFMAKRRSSCGDNGHTGEFSSLGRKNNSTPSFLDIVSYESNGINFNTKLDITSNDKNNKKLFKSRRSFM